MSSFLCSFFKACSKVCAYVSKQVERVRRSMDGKNVDTVLTELGVRFHRLIHEHLQQFSYSSMGGMLAICDVAEYRRSAKDFKVRRGQRSYFCNLMALYIFIFCNSVINYSSQYCSKPVRLLSIFVTLRKT